MLLIPKSSACIEPLLTNVASRLPTACSFTSPLTILSACIDLLSIFFASWEQTILLLNLICFLDKVKNLSLLSSRRQRNGHRRYHWNLRVLEERRLLMRLHKELMVTFKSSLLRISSLHNLLMILLHLSELRSGL